MLEELTFYDEAALIRGGMHPSEALSLSRSDAIGLIREALERRSGKKWSVTGGRGTAWGWITITSPPARRVSSDGTPQEGRNWYMSESDCRELGELLGLDAPAHCQGVSIPDASDYRRVYVERALGVARVSHAERYWD